MATPVHMTARQVDANPHMEDSAGMTHWRCTLTYCGRRMVITFSMGSAHNGRMPEVREVLSRLALDASGYDNSRGFDDWCADYGYDSDSRKAERTYRAVERQAMALHRLLGADFERITASVAEA